MDLTYPSFNSIRDAENIHTIKKSRVDGAEEVDPF
jgi:hypothetical protein